MRKTIMMAVATAGLLSTSAFAAPNDYYGGPGYPAATAAELGAGAAVGTVAGVGVANGWFGGTVGASTAGITTAGAGAIGGVAGVGTVALIDAAVQPCSGFHAVFGANQGHCVNGQYVEYVPQRRVYRR